MTTEAAIPKEEEYRGQLSWPVWKKVLAYARPHKRYLIGLIVTAVALAAIDTALPLVTRGIINDARYNGTEAKLWLWILMYACLTAVFCTFVCVFITLAGKVSTGIAHDIRRDGFRRLQELSFSYYDRRPVGWLVARMTSDCDQLSRIIAWSSLDVTWGACMLVGTSALMLALRWQLALVLMGVLPPLAWLSMVFQKRLLATSRKARKTNSNITAAYSEAIMGVRTTKVLVREKENLREFGGKTDEMFAASVHNAVLRSMYFPLILSMGSVGAGLALWRGGGDYLAGSMDIGTLVLFISITGHFVFPMQELARAFADLQAGQAAAERITGLLETQPEVKDSPEVRAAIEKHAASAAGAGQGLAVDGMENGIDSVEFRKVTFAYKEGKEVLKDFDLTVTPGQTIAIVGPTGGGKTTIVSLLCRFYEPTAGEILINGVDYRKRSLQWLQSNLGIVLQTPHLFSGTIRQNIRYGNLQASDEQVEWAAKLVNAHGFIMDFDDGYDTEIGQGGNKLSTGQKQLVSFARAILADPRIFVMDEATSSVDTETEQLIQRGLATVLKGRISFVIAHRLSTIRSADEILVIRKGRLVEKGTHPELIRLRGEYYQLYTNQFTLEQQERILASGD